SMPSINREETNAGGRRGHDGFGMVGFIGVRDRRLGRHRADGVTQHGALPGGYRGRGIRSQPRDHHGHTARRLEYLTRRRTSEPRNTWGDDATSKTRFNQPPPAS